MALYRTDVEWHDLRIDPEDLPSEEDTIIVTVETFIGRQTWLDVFMREETAGEPIFYTTSYNAATRVMEECAVWYPVVAWAYPPPPYNFF